VGYVPILSNVSFALPLVILTAVGLVWWWTTRVSAPPRLRASPPLRSWRVNPVAAVYTSLQGDQYLLASFLLRERLSALAQEQFHVPPAELRSWIRSKEAPALPAPLTPRAVWAHLNSAYRAAYLAEGAPSWEIFSEYTLPRRRQQAVREFARAAVEVEQVVAAWKEAS
jgi:hypothetical protein